MQELLINDQVNTLAAIMVRSGCVRDTLSRQALLIRIGINPGHRQCDGIAPDDFAVLLANDLSETGDRDKLKRLLQMLRDALAQDPEIPALLQILGASPGPAREGFEALSVLLGDPRIREAAQEFRGAFTATRARIAPVVEYKLVHDQLHQLEFNCYNRIRNNLARFSDANDDDANEEMANCQGEFETIVRSLRALTDGPVFGTVYTGWVGELETASRCLQTSVDNRDIAGIRTVLNKTSRILARRPDEINKFLVEAARQLKLGDLVTKMRRLHGRLLVLNVDSLRADELRRGVDQLDALDTKLESLIRIHTIWQEIDVELRPIEGLLADSIASGDFSWWDNLKELTMNLSDGAPLAYRDLAEGGVKLIGAIEQRSPNSIKDSFRRLQRQIKVGFRDADEALKRQCVALPEVFSPLPGIEEVLE